ncbi:hypothetical protein RYH73_08930 [Olivibacter sp. CPCC 100613]|uniref:hypothetical protein n=1 Tax=Olivibacter sp. CPCC 100613 TaxID=3079931 RepID=UPI002FFCF981
MKNYILIFKTSIDTAEDEINIASILNNFPSSRSWTVDLEDCDKVLRVCAASDISAEIIRTLRQEGFLCEPMDW